MFVWKGNMDCITYSIHYVPRWWTMIADVAIGNSPNVFSKTSRPSHNTEELGGILLQRPYFLCLYLRAMFYHHCLRENFCKPITPTSTPKPSGGGGHPQNTGPWSNALAVPPTIRAQISSQQVMRCFGYYLNLSSIRDLKRAAVIMMCWCDRGTGKLERKSEGRISHKTS